MRQERRPTATLPLGLLLLAVAGSALAQGVFTEADLLGSYVISSRVDRVLENNFDTGAISGNASMLGVLHADGAGNVTGTRTFQRPIVLDGGPALPLHQHQEFIEQTITGTYAVNSDGTGTMWLLPDPNPPWYLPSSREIRITFTGGGPEILRFALAEDGRSFRFTQELRATRLQAGVHRDTHFVLKGIAETQERLEIPEPEPDPRIDVLIDQLDAHVAENAVLKAQLCEILRLLNTPQGQRVSDSPDVVDACGTAFAWNAEGTDTAGARRGR